MTLNGIEKNLTEPVPLIKFLVSQGLDPDRVAVLKNSEIISKESFASAIVSQNDALEVVSFVGGG